MGELPGRKAVLLISDRLRDPARAIRPLFAAASPPWRIARPPCCSPSIWATAPEQPFLSGTGPRRRVRDTGGLFVDGGDVAKILDRIAQQQAGYYVLTYRAEASPSIS